MKSSVVLVVAVIVVAALGVYLYYNNQNKETTVPSGSHIYLGAIYNGQSEELSYVSASIDIGKGSDLNNTVYYVVLSIWDSNTSYDQVGIASIKGHFYSTYSYTYLLNGSIQYLFKPDWFPISRGTHAISMAVKSGYVTFTVDSESFIAFTGGDYFIASQNEHIGNNSTNYYGFTVYEEIYGFNNTLPSIPYNFSNIQADSINLGFMQISKWIPINHNISSSFSNAVYIVNNTVNIYNMPSFVLNVEIKNLQSPGLLSVSDIILPVNPGETLYPLNLLPGNYTLTLTIDSQSSMTYNVSVRGTTEYTITA